LGWYILYREEDTKIINNKINTFNSKTNEKNPCLKNLLKLNIGGEIRARWIL
jgi:hypothetical protein